MEVKDTELLRAMHLERQLTEDWAVVYLKSGQLLYIQASHWFVVDKVVQEASVDDSEVVEVSERVVEFADASGEPVGDIFLRFSEVAAIRVLTPAQVGSSSISLE